MTDLKGLTIARFFAAFGVVLFHKHVPGSQAGYTLVEFFFILSGFILVYSSKDLAEKYGFYVRRVARIYPIYLLAWLLFGLTIIDQKQLYEAAIYGGLSVTLLQSWIPTAAPEWNFPGWSLSVEAFFYAVFPFILPTLAKLRTAQLRVLLLVLLALNALYWLLVRSTEGIPFKWVTVGGYLEFLPAVRLQQFLAGAVVGLLYERAKPLAHAWRWSLAITALIIVTMQWQMPYIPAVLAVEYCALVYALGFTRADGPVAELGALLGKASYALYILQLPLYRMLGELGFVWYCLLLILISVLVYQLIERPAERWIKATLIRRQPVTTSAPESPAEPLRSPRTTARLRPPTYRRPPA